jgi:alkanesulfonate monooxygenase SsuD/methylene tetrahydromethanopterin reductase-like flavin-dependent oxidoreductase (luciferase family)
VNREAEARRIARAAKQARPRTPRWLVALSIVVGATCCLALAIAWYGNRDVKAEHGVHALAGANNSGFAAGLLVGIAIGVIATAAVLARKR